MVLFHKTLKIGFVMALVFLTSCQYRNDEFVDFTDIEAAKDLKFKVIGQHETDLGEGIPYDCYLPNGERVVEWPGDEVAEAGTATNGGPRKTSSVTAAALIQELLKYGNQNRVTEIVGIYPSWDGDGNPVMLSGKVLLPAGRKPKRLILVSHYTIGSNAEAPSNCFPLEGILVKMGYGLIIPDYRGYGVTADQIHPYLVMLETAFNVTDMYFAVRDWLKAVDRAPENEDIYLMGYSQGGATTMAVEYVIEMAYDDPEDPEYYIPIHRVFAGGGPYDVRATFERFISTDVTDYPVAVPLVLQGMIKGNNLKVKMEELMQPWLYEKMDEWVNSKRYTTGQINNLIGTKVTHELLTEKAMKRTSDDVAELYKAMTANSLVAYNWQPQASVYIMHSMQDETVPFQNATSAKTRWSDANITYNFGRYGTHVATCLRFIGSVQSLLEAEEKERREYEN
jgi:pimeloyl-ACP methyl ester carboxylesterase